MLAALHRYMARHKMVSPGDRIGVAVSGGADSVCLLRLLLDVRAELGLVLHVAHFDHQLRAESGVDVQFVEALAREHDLSMHFGSGDTRAYAAEKRISLETAARDLRYQFFDSLLREGVVDKIAAGHTLSDQAETVLMKLLRGAGARGLSGIHPVLARTRGEIIRPLLFASRAEIETQLANLQQPFRTDATNADITFTRNRVRHGIMPLLADINPDAEHALAQTAEILREEDAFLDAEAERTLPFVLQTGAPARGGGRAAGVGSSVLFSLSLEALSPHPVALQRRILRLACTGVVSLTLDETDRVLALGDAAANTTLELRNGVRVRRLHREIQFLRADAATRMSGGTYEQNATFTGDPLTLSGPLCSIELSLAEGSAAFDQELALPLRVMFRNWRSGDRFHAPYTRTSRKVKEHLQALKLTHEERALWPVLEDLSTHELLWVRGLPLRRLTCNGKALRIRESQSSSS